MTAYTVYITSTARIIAFYILFYFIGFITSCVLFVLLIEDEDLLGIALIFSWFILFLGCYHLAKKAGSKKYAASFKYGNLQLTGTRGNTLHFSNCELKNHKLLYVGSRPESLILYLQNGTQVKLSGRLFRRRSLIEFSAFTEAFNEALSGQPVNYATIPSVSDKENVVADSSAGFPKVVDNTTDAIHCRALKVYGWLSFGGILIATVNALFFGLVLLALYEELSAVGVIVALGLVLAEIVGVYWFFIVLFRRPLEVDIYRDKVMIKMIKKYAVQTEKVQEFYFKDLSKFEVWEPYRGNARIVLTDKKNRKFSFQEYFPFVVSKAHTACYVVNTLSAAFNEFTANYKTGVKIKIRSSRGAGKLGIIGDIADTLGW
ncbi:hypothetical protein CJD36_014885 [Flavipsychrobacter stenotrophus]|uniref:Uncharacterized protein n=1 Tax=Flavipsychrobacter stenotrophus TaxID=2077091 RepID=A0A2S7SSS6_9BACT|nr:hypothetical protein [Flavipsychrobacter stenotrophus]PQJ09982.1 hypothetical protein CJD36_014885 [Flavipsychrobacter stenotrophus]